MRGAGATIHTHSLHAVLVTLLCESQQHLNSNVFEIEHLEQIKGVPKGYGEEKKGNLGYFDRLRIPIIENTAHEEDLRDTLEGAIREWPDTYAVLVRRHGLYVWGKDVAQAKTQCERYVDDLQLSKDVEMWSANEVLISLDYIFQLAVEMHKLGLPWTRN